MFKAESTSILARSTRRHLTLIAARQLIKIRLAKHGLLIGALLVNASNCYVTSNAQASAQPSQPQSPDQQDPGVFPVRSSKGSIWSRVYPGQHIWNETIFKSTYPGQISRELYSKISCPSPSISGLDGAVYPSLAQKSTKAAPFDTDPTQLRFGQLVQVPAECSIGGLLILKTYAHKRWSSSYIPITQLLGIVTARPPEITNDRDARVYSHHFGEGSIEIRDTSGSEALSELQLVGITPDSIKVAFLENDLILTIRGVETIRVFEQGKTGEAYGVHTISFVNNGDKQSWTRDDIRMRALADAKPSGFVNGSEHADIYTHEPTDGSYEINDIGPANAIDSLVLRGMHPQDLTLATDHSDLLVNFPGNQTVRIKGHYNPSATQGIEEIVFLDRDSKLVWDRAMLSTRAMSDMRAKGRVTGTPFADTFTHSLSDDSFWLRDFGPADEIDTLVLKEVSPEDVRLSAQDRDLTIHLPNKKTIRILNQRYPSREYGIEIIEFPDAQPATSWSRDDILTRVVSDMKSTWFVQGTERADTYLHYPEDPSYKLVDVGPPANTDTLVLHEIGPDEVKLQVQRNDLILELSEEKRIRIQRQFDEGSAFGIEIIEFPNARPPATWSRDEMLRRSLEDMKSTGTVNGTSRADTFIHNPNDPSYVIHDYGPSSAADTLILKGRTPDDVRLSAQEDDLILSLPGQRLIEIAAQLQPASWFSYGIESLRFEGGPSPVVWDRSDIIDNLANQSRHDTPALEPSLE